MSWKEGWGFLEFRDGRQLRQSQLFLPPSMFNRLFLDFQGQYWQFLAPSFLPLPVLEHFDDLDLVVGFGDILQFLVQDQLLLVVVH